MGTALGGVRENASSKVPLTVGDLDPIYYVFPWTHPSPHSKRCLNGLAVFAGLTVVTERSTDHGTPSVTTIDRITYIASAAMQLNNNNNNNNNNMIARAFSSAGLPVTKEPSGLFRSDGKRPDGLTLVPWSSGKALCWDVTITCPLAESYISAAARESGAAAELAASRKEEKYADLDWPIHL